jgi:diguanylate cyclase (GGDEF)-like protein
VNDGKQREAEIYLHHKDGHRVPVHVRVSPVVNEFGQIIGAVEIFSNNAMQVQMAERLAEMERLALVDSLTGLANRRFLESHMRSRLEELRRNNWPFGVLFIDVDGFKNINDANGHDVGDQVLKMVGRTLDKNSRYFDAVGRWGGDEFLVVTANIHNGRLREIAERFRVLVGSSVLREPLSLSVTVSVGGALACEDDTIESLMRRTDEKLYMAKQAGRNCVCL